MFVHVSFREAASRGFHIYGHDGVDICEENAIPVVVFNLLEPGNISGALCGEQVGTVIDQTGMIS
ncbi:hypothetical protein BVRB_7g161340 [Beta vulgaris subsp. vulgaris]|nr:hypothetical protein BVRB_7g161340 [Beta vulgaris subsp. vulgaris]